MDPGPEGEATRRPPGSSRNATKRRSLTDEEVLHSFDEFLYHGEIRDFLKAQHSFERISSSLGTEDFDVLIPPCLEVLEFSNQLIRDDTLLCLLYISLGCTLCDVPSETLVAAMRSHAAMLAKHDAMPMFIRSLDFLLGYDAEKVNVEDGILEREFRLIFNCIYIQLLFNEHDEGFVRALELGQGRLGASLVSLLFEATKMCADNDKIPIKKVILLLFKVLQCLLDIPDNVLYPMPNPEPSPSPTPQATIQRPQLREFQAFSAMHLHEKNMLQKYYSLGRPAAIEEGLQIIQRYKDDFIMHYAFHPSEITFMQTTPFLRPSYLRYEQLHRHSLTAPKKEQASLPPYLPAATLAEKWASRLVRNTFGTVDTPVGGGADETSMAGGCAEPPFVGRRSSLSDGEDTKDMSSHGSTFASDSESEAGERGALARTRSASSRISSCSSNSAASAATAVPLTGRSGERGNAAGDDLGEGFGATSEVAGERPPQLGGAYAEGAPAPDASKNSCVYSNSGRVAGLDLLESIHDRSPAAVFQRLYLAIFPRLTEIVVLLLRLLLTSCSNVENYPGVIDMSRERRATAMPDDGCPDRVIWAQFEEAMPPEATEIHRHREIMAAAVSGVILILLKQARKPVAEQFSSLAQLITDSNGALVVLKFLNQDLSSAMEPRDPYPVMACLQGQRATPGTRIPSWHACATLRLVEVLYLLCKDSPDRVRKYLIHYKAPFILKRLHRIDNQHVQSLVLKLLKKQVRYLPRKWKQANMKAISAIYSLVPMSPLEDWLLNEPFGESSTEGPTQADIRASNVLYNADLLRHLSAGTSRSFNPNGTSCEGHVAAMRALRPDCSTSPRTGGGAPVGSTAAGVLGSASAGIDSFAGGSVGTAAAQGNGAASFQAGLARDCDSTSFRSTAEGCDGFGVPLAFSGASSRSVVRSQAAALALANLPGLSLSPAALAAVVSNQEQVGEDVDLAGFLMGHSLADVHKLPLARAATTVPLGDPLLEELGDEQVLGYIRMFPEYVPAGCG